MAVTRVRFELETSALSGPPGAWNHARLKTFSGTIPSAFFEGEHHVAVERLVCVDLSSTGAVDWEGADFLPSLKPQNSAQV